MPETLKANFFSISAISLLLAVCLLHWSSPYLMISGLYDDIFVPFDAGLRWNQGLIPSIDFPSPLGAFYYIVNGLGIASADNSAVGILRANIIAVLVFLPFLIVPLRRRLNDLLSAIVLISLVFWSISPGFAQGDIKDFVHLASYNRYGLAWAAWLSIILILPPVTDSKKAPPSDLVAIALLAAGLFFTKVSFLPPLLVGAIFYFFQAGMTSVIKVAISTIALIAISSFFLGFEYLPSYIKDIHYVFSIQDFERSVLANLKQTFLYFFMDLLLISILCFYVFINFDRRYVIKSLLYLISSFIISFLLTINMHDYYAPYFGISAVVFVAYLCTTTEDKRKQLSVSLLAVSVLILPLSLSGLQVLEHRMYAQRMAKSPSGYISVGDLKLAPVSDSGPLESDKPLELDKLLKRTPFPLQEIQQIKYEIRVWAKMHNMAKTLIEQDSGLKNKKVLCLGFANSCLVSSHIRSPANIPLWWHQGRSFGLPLPETVSFKDVDALLVPVIDPFDYAKTVKDATRDVIAADFKLVKTNPLWQLYTRKSQ